MSFGVSASDFVTLPQFAWSVYTACRDSVSEYTELAGEVQLMHAVLCELDSLLSGVQLDQDSKPRLALVQKSCQDFLEALNCELEKYKSLGTGKKLLVDRMRWAMKKNVGSWRSRLISHSTMLTPFVLALQKPPNVQVKSGADIDSAKVVGLPLRPARPLGETLSTMGVPQACSRCKILKLQCTDGLPCLACSHRGDLQQQLPCRRGPLKFLSRDLIPTFHSPSVIRRYRHFDAHQTFLLTLRTLPTGIGLPSGPASLIVDCRLLNLEISLSDTLDGVKSRVISAFREVFQHTFPDNGGLRARLVEEGCRYRIFAHAQHDQNYWLVTMAENFMTLSFMLSHCPSMRAVFRYRIPNRQHSLWAKVSPECLHKEVAIMLATCLEHHLELLLEMLQETISRQRRKDWPAIALALCTLLFGIESIQVDIHLRSPKARSICKSMEDTAILMLTEIFSASTAGFKPLSLDWGVEENAALVDYDEHAVETIRGLQEVSQEYCKKAVLYPIIHAAADHVADNFLNERNGAEFDDTDTDCLTGKLVSRIIT